VVTPALTLSRSIILAMVLTSFKFDFYVRRNANMMPK
jgi:hypothetical protein